MKTDLFASKASKRLTLLCLQPCSYPREKNLTLRLNFLSQKLVEPFRLSIFAAPCKTVERIAESDALKTPWWKAEKNLITREFSARHLCIYDLRARNVNFKPEIALSF